MIIKKQKIKKYKYNAKNNFDNTDCDYKELIKRTESTYYILQKAWAENNIIIAKDYLTKELYDNLKQN